jgi:hypothetical protein
VSLPNYNAPQKAPVEPGWAEIRESQWRTARSVPNTGLAVTIDIGDPKDIHPRNKPEVGRRLSLVARLATGFTQGSFAIGALTDSARTVLAGILLIFPGVVSDLIALTLLLWPGPRFVVEPVSRRERPGTFIEGDFRRTR